MATRARNRHPRRVGTNGLAPISVAERSLGAGSVAVGRPRRGGRSRRSSADQLTKYVVRAQLRLDESVNVLGPLAIHRVQNSGIAFGLFACATVVVIAADRARGRLDAGFFARSGARHPVLPAALGLLIGGSISNLVDRVRLGHVTDFLDLRWWPAFNLADSFIVIGVGILRRARSSTAAAAAGRGRVAACSWPAAPGAPGERLDRVPRAAPDVGSRAAAEAVAAGVLVDGRLRPKSYRLAGGERVGARARGAAPGPARRRRSRAIAYQDEHLLVVDKPAGLVVHPGRRARGAARSSSASPGDVAGGDTRSGRDRPPPRPRHVRADRRRALRGGVRAAAGARPQPRARARPTSRSSRGRPRSRTRPDRGADRPRPRRPDAASRSTPTRRATRSRTSRSSDCWPRHALLRVRLETGRTHQIRVHLAAIDLPVVGDPVYGVAGPALERQFLHAARLAFTHPFTRRAGRRRVAAPGRPRGAPRAARADAASGRGYHPRSPVPRPGGGSRRTVAGAAPVPRETPPVHCNRNRERGSHARRLHERPAGGRSPLRPPDPALEPEDEALHLHRARRHLHHRPAAVASSCSTTPTTSRAPSPSAAAPSSSSARRSRRRTRSPARRRASGCRT